MIKLLILDANLGGKKGNTFQLFSPKLNHFLSKHKNIKATIFHLSDEKKSYSQVTFWKKTFSAHDAVFILTGTYWDSWSSHLQRFLEITTELECDHSFFGKPVGAMVSMHSVGGKEVLSRLQGVLSTQGYLVPPQTSLVISLATEMALLLEKKTKKKNFSADFWSTDEIPEILWRLIAYAQLKPMGVRPWEVDKKDPKRQWAKLLNA